jgi:hypothetical protein
MSRTRMFIALAATLAAGAIAASASAGPIAGDKHILTKPLMPLKGSASGEAATVEIDAYARKVCFALDVKSPVTGAAIQKGDAVIVKLAANKAGKWDGCVDIAQDAAIEIAAKPADYSLSINAGALSANLGS